MRADAVAAQLFGVCVVLRDEQQARLPLFVSRSRPGISFLSLITPRARLVPTESLKSRLSLSYMLYYICPMHTIFTLIIYAVLGIGSKYNSSDLGLAVKARADDESFASTSAPRLSSR